MYNYDIVIVDTGIEIEHSIFKNTYNLHCFGVDYIRGKLRIVDYCQDEIGHGTAVTGIIATKCPSAEICIIKIFGSVFDVSQERLFFALDYIEKNVRCRIINLSLGITCYSVELEGICERLKEKGCVIISAFDNEGAISYPAAFSSVIGVDASEKCKRPDCFIVKTDTLVDVLAYGYNHRVAWLNNSYIFTRGSSFSTAYITAKLYNDYAQRSSKISLKGAKRYLAGVSSEKKINAPTYHNKKHDCSTTVMMDAISEVAVFPYNKEMHSLINFSHLLNFNIRHIYDVKQLGKTGIHVKGLQSGHEFIIENIEDANWRDIDTLIIGHLDQISVLGMKQIKEQLLKKCLKNKVNVYSFDKTDVEKYMIPFFKRGLWIQYPNMDGGEAKKKSAKMYMISTPVLGIFGTSSNQGKFTLQLQLREYFMRDSYAVGQIGSEPSSLLFGMDQVFAYGYSSHLQLDQMFVIEKMNELLYDIDKEKKDIILVGGQSGTIPIFSFHLKYFNIQTLNVLMGANPDGVVLCVNLFDSMDYLKRCIYTITNIVDCSIIAIAISPLTVKNGWQQINGTRVAADKDELQKFKAVLRDRFSLDSYIIGTDEVRELYHQCIDFFSRDGEETDKGGKSDL